MRPTVAAALVFCALVTTSTVGAAGTSTNVSNAEMTAMFDADQKVREAEVKKLDWSKIGPEDAKRRKRTRALLDTGRLHTGEDFYHAAFVFQHGDTSDDILLAHSLAIAAMKLGRPDASWIAAATLDRYLQRIGQKQVFGTQFNWRTGQPWTMEPYNRELIPDLLREVVGVPKLGEQQERLDKIKAVKGP